MYTTAHNYKSISGAKAWDWILQNTAQSTNAAVRHGCRRQRHSHTACPVRRQSCDLEISIVNQHVAGVDPYALQDSSGDLLSGNSSRRMLAGNLLPDPVLFGRIKACYTLFDCQQLLSRNCQQLDAMLLSSLVTQTVLVTVDVPQQAQQELQHRKLQQDCHPQQNHVVQQSTAAAEPATAAVGAAAASLAQCTEGSAVQSSSGYYGSSSSAVQHRTSSARPLKSSRSTVQAWGRYLRQLSDVALRLCSSFRPQQFANVLWGLAKCGYKAPPAWIRMYLAQAELQLVRFSPRNLAQLIWALAAMKAEIPRQFYANFLAECSDKLSGFKPIDLANTLWGLATLTVQPPRDWLATALAACERQWLRFKPQELSIAVWGLAKLGMGFRGQPGHQHYGVAGGLDSAGVQGLMGVITQQMPVMTPQQASNLVWGLAVGQAPLSPQQVQALADQALLVLRQSASSCYSHALTTVTWALTKLHWTPSQHQVHQLLSLFQQQQQQHALSARQAALLLWCCSKLQLRLPAPAMQQLMAQMTAVLPTAAPADAVQLLTGCKTLGWRPSKVWWLGFYAQSVVLLEQASVAELAQLLAAAAAVVPLRPTKPWWLGFWRQVAAAADDTFDVRQLQRKGQLAIAAPKRRSSKRLSSSSSGSGSSNSRLLSQHTAARPKAGSSSSAGNRHSSNTKAAVERQLLKLNPYAVLQRYMQRYASLRAAAQPLPQKPSLQHLVVNPYSAMALLWASAKLRMLMPKKVLWQLLLLVLLDVPCYSARQLGTIMQTIGVMIATHGHDKVQCYTVLKYLTVAAQWRLHSGRAGEGAVLRRYNRALRFMAYEANTSMLLVPSWQGGNA